VYEAHELKAESGINSLSAKADLIGSIEETARLLSEIASMNSALASAAPVTATEAIRILRRIAARVAVPETYGPPAVEVLDWIEMHSDDAPVKIILGMNEGCVPEPMTGDPLIPDSLRKELGITDSAARYARDAYLLAALGASTPHLALITGTTNAVGEPVPPSRLLLACDGDTLVNRAQRFFSGRSPTRSSVTLYAAGQHSQYTPIRPVKPEAPIRELSVTAFRDYLACPYRFYLKHVLRLESVDDRAENLDSAQFGSLLHEVIGEFSRKHLDDNIDVDQTFGVLRDILRSRAIAHFGSKPIVTVNLQLEQIATRLERFAAWHCYHTQNGWVTQPDWTERLAQVSLDVDGAAVTIRGRIDRIDYNAQEGRYVVVDYKSSETRPDPERTHRRADGTTRVWTDLQLPLYRLMVMKTILDAGAQDVGTALLWLSPDQQGPDRMLFEANWTEADYASAEECAVSVVRRIFAGEFWPPAVEPPRHDDGLRVICMDDCSDRFALLRNPPAPWDNP
jgi:hypothetical protein